MALALLVTTGPRNLLKLFIWPSIHKGWAALFYTYIQLLRVFTWKKKRITGNQPRRTKLHFDRTLIHSGHTNFNFNFTGFLPTSNNLANVCILSYFKAWWLKKRAGLKPKKSKNKLLGQRSRHTMLPQYNKACKKLSFINMLVVTIEEILTIAIVGSTIAIILW